MYLMLFNLWARLSYFLKDFFLYEVLLTLSFFLFIFLTYKVYKSSSSSFCKKVYFFLISLFFVLILVYSGFEAYYRYRYDQSDGLGFLKVNERWHRRHVVYNSDFFRDRDFAQKKPGTVRVGVLGDSIAFGGGINDVENRFSNLLEKKLKNSGYDVEVYNLGKPGYDTDGEIEFYQKVKYLGFDIVVWEYFLNDIQPKGKSTGTPIIIKESKQGKIVKFFSDRSFFFDYLYWRLSQRYNKTLGELRTADLARYSDTAQLASHYEQISSFLQSLKGENTRTVVVIFPLLFFLGPDYPAANIHQMMTEHFLDSGAVDVVDMLDYLKDKNGRDLWASEFDSHPNEYVHKITAEKLFEKIVPLLK